MAHGVAVIDDDPGQDRDHRKHAGRQRQEQTEAEEAEQHQRQAVALEQAGDARTLIARCRGRFLGQPGRRRRERGD